MTTQMIVVLISDRHADPSVYVFPKDKLLAALAFARGEALLMARGDEKDMRVSLSQAMENQGWLWYAEVGPEGDSVRVQTVPLQ